MGLLWILAEEEWRGTPILRKLAQLPEDVNEGVANQVFDAIVGAGGYEKVFLVEVKRRG